MQGSTVVINPPDGEMAAYLASLNDLADDAGRRFDTRVYDDVPPESPDRARLAAGAPAAPAGSRARTRRRRTLVGDRRRGLIEGTQVGGSQAFATRLGEFEFGCRALPCRRRLAWKTVRCTADRSCCAQGWQ